MKLEAIKARIDELISKSDAVLKTSALTKSRIPTSYVNSVKFAEWRVGSLSFLRLIFGNEHIFPESFEAIGVHAIPSAVHRGSGILIAAKEEIDGGWLVSVKGLISAEIFSDFLEMAEHLLSQGYRDPAAVMIGSVLEEHLRQLCQNNALPIDTIKDGKSIPKKADTMNADLAKAGIYNLLSQKSVTAWLDLRNKAAHGQYGEYSQEEVKLMYQGVTDFIARTT